LLSTGFTLPYALVQPVLGALADMFSKTRLISICMLILGLTTIACGFATNFDTLMTLRVLAGITAGGVFPIALAVAGDRVPVAQRQVAIGRLLFAAMSGNLLGASGAGVIGDLIGWRGVFFATGAIDLIALAFAIPGFRGMNETPGRFDLSNFIPNYRAVFGNPLAKYCFGAVFLEAIFLFGVFPYMAVLLRSEGVTRASIAGVVIGGFAIGGIIYTLTVSWLVTHIGERRLMASGGMVMAICLAVDRAARALAGRIRQFRFCRFRLLPAARLHPGLCHRTRAGGARLCDRRAFGIFLSRPGDWAGGLWLGPQQRRHHSGAADGHGRFDADRLDLRATPSASRSAASAIGRDALVGHPDTFRQSARLPEHVDWHAAARIPVAANAQPFRLEPRDQLFADGHGAVLVEGAVIAETVEIELERLRLD
jgi:MFS family permease